MKNSEFDILILGGGIAGTALAMVAAKLGAKVIVVEKGSHPRFVIGESTVPTSTLGWLELSHKFDIPEFRTFSTYHGMKKAGLTGYPKQSFYFAHHEEGKPMIEGHEAMFDTFRPPIGPDVHMLRADIDTYMAKQLSHYDIEYRELTTLENYNVDQKTKKIHMTFSKVVTKDENANKSESEGLVESAVTAKLVFDATGHGAVLGRRFGLRDSEPQLKTNTRGIYGHFKNVNRLEKVLGKSDTFRYNRDSGTMHHCFKGGWMWIIPFDNGVTSVGLLLDPRLYPYDDLITAEEEIFQHINRFPTVKEHLGSMKPIMDLVRSRGRIQFTTSSIIGPGCVLTPHAAGFIDPLFSTGLTLTQSFISRSAPIIKQCLADDNFDTNRFRAIEDVFFREINTIDLLVSGTIKSYDDFEMFRQYWQTWTKASNIQVFGRLLGDHSDPQGCASLFGTNLRLWPKIVESRNNIVFNDSISTTRRAAQLESPVAPNGHPKTLLKIIKTEGLHKELPVRLLLSLYSRFKPESAKQLLGFIDVFGSFTNVNVGDGACFIGINDFTELDEHDPKLKKAIAGICKGFGGDQVADEAKFYSFLSDVKELKSQMLSEQKNNPDMKFAFDNMLAITGLEWRPETTKELTTNNVSEEVCET